MQRSPSINTGLSGEIISAEEIPVSEFYVFRDNGTFSKEFQDDFTQGNANGSYSLMTTNENDYLILTYNDDAIDSLSYCSTDRIENMLISSDARGLSNIECSAFDGPGMLYIRTK